MIINHANLAILNQAYNAAFQSGLTTAAPMWNQLAMLVPSTTSTEVRMAGFHHEVPRVAR